MQTMSVQIEDSYVEKFISYVNKNSENITISKDKNLEIDPYFYERREKLHKIREDIHNGNMKLLTQEEADNEIELFFKKLENSQWK